MHRRRTAARNRMATPIIANPMSFCELSLEDGIRKVLAIGYDHIELWRNQLAAFGTTALRVQLRDYVVSLGSQIVGLNAADAPYFQSLGGPADIGPALVGLRADIDTAADLGADYVSTFEGRRDEAAGSARINGPIFDATRLLFEQACAYGASRGIRLLVEVHPFTLGVDVDWLCRLHDAIGAVNFGVIYDPCHFAVALPDGYLDAIDRLGHRICCVHFCDSDKVSCELHFPPGKGCLDLQGILGALRRINFSGSWMVDHWLYPLREEAARSGLAFLREALDGFAAQDTQREDRSR